MEKEYVRCGSDFGRKLIEVFSLPPEVSKFELHVAADEIITIKLEMAAKFSDEKFEKLFKDYALVEKTIE